MSKELNQTQIEEMLHKQIIGRIGCHADNTTYIVPISYAYDGEYIYGHAQEGMKVDMMRKNRNVCFEVDNMQNMGGWQSVIAWGEFEELKEAALRHKALRKLHERSVPNVASVTAKLSAEWPFVPAEPNKIKGVVFRIHLHKKTGRFENYSVTSSLA